jgi:predicted  nucleic acid-binding Zn-ribbon protein
MLLGWSASTHDKELTDKLTNLADARKRQVAIQNELASLDSEIEKTINEQERIRRNIGAVPDNSDLKKRYLKALADSEDQIAAMNERRDSVQEESDRRGDHVTDIIRTF